MFTPDLEQNACEMSGEGDPAVIVQGLLNVPKALASPRGSVLSYQPEFRGEWRSDRRAA